MKMILKLVIAGLLVHACWRGGMVFWRYYKFKDGVQATAQFAGARSPAEIQHRVTEIAGELDVPINPETIDVRREENHTLIDADYVDRVEILPSYFYPWQFRVHVDAFTMAPARPGDLDPGR